MKERNFALSLLLMIMLVGLTPPIFSDESKESNMTPDQVLQTLKNGNERFVNDEREFPHLDKARLLELTKGQNPYVTVLSCSDSRVPPEHIFDAGLGDIFSIRVAGNISDTNEIGSIEYGIEHLETPLLVVLGHTSCGAVTAVVNNAEVHGNIPALIQKIVPAKEEVKAHHPHLEGDELINQVVKANIWNSIDHLLAKSSATLKRIQKEKLKIVGAVYHLDNGNVEWLGEHPKQDKLLEKYKTHTQAKEKKMSESKYGFIHIVFFWLDNDTPEVRKQQLIDDCHHLLGTVETVRKIEVGTPAGTPRDVVDNTFGVNLIVYFDDKEGHDYYQEAEKHLEFIERNKDIWKRVQVYDVLPE